jgi:hypothetical protein
MVTKLEDAPIVRKLIALCAVEVISGAIALGYAFQLI